jgi:COP9 signalosome complex subunit 7
MDFTAYTAKLEPFMLMSKSVKGAAAAKLVQDATAAQGVYVFAQLLEVPNIKEVRHYFEMYLANTEYHRLGFQLQNLPNHQASYALLELFAYGTYQDYKGINAL